MKKFEKLFRLVKTLNKQEKKQFSIFSKNRAGGKLYKFLFELIDSDLTDLKIIRNKFSQKFPATDFDTTVNHLYKTLLKSLIFNRESKTIENELNNNYNEAIILFEKLLFKECFDVLVIALQKALKFEKLDWYVLISRLYLDYLNMIGYNRVNEQDLIRIQANLDSAVKNLQTIIKHKALFHIAGIRFLTNGHVKNQKEKDMMNDLLLSEVRISQGQASEYFEIQSNHLLFQSVYFLMTNNFRSGMESYELLLTLLLQKQEITSQNPLYYLFTLKGILNNLCALEQFQMAKKFTGELAKIFTTTQFSNFAIVYNFIYSARIALALNEVTEIEDLLKNYHSHYTKLLKILPAKLQMEFILTVSLLLYYKKNRSAALKLLNEIYLHYFLFKDHINYRMASLMRIVIYYDEKNLDQLETSVNSYIHVYIKQKICYQSEILLLAFLKKTLTISSLKKLNNQKIKLEEQLILLKNDLHERQFFQIFDFLKWIEGTSDHTTSGKGI